MVVVEGTKIRRHALGLIPKRRIFSCMISEGTVIQKSWHHSYVKAIAPHFFVLSRPIQKRPMLLRGDALQDFAQELFGSGICRTVKEYTWRTVLDDDASVGEIDMVGNFAGKAHFMGHKDTSHTIIC